MEHTGLDWTLAFGGIIGALLVLGTVLLAFTNHPIPSEISTGDLAVIGFFFSKGIVQTVANVLPLPRNQPPTIPPAPPENTK